jgi:hypothetical protein
MSGTLFDLARLFPGSPQEWDVAHPAKAVVAGIRAHVRRQFGTLQTAADKARVKEPTRLGVALRPYEPGDPLRALSRSHLIRTNELVTRTDYAVGRRTCAILFHAYENMHFQSPDAPANKGQVALALSALVEAVYESLAQTCLFRVVREKNLGDVVAHLGAGAKRPDDLIVVTDLLFWPHAMEASARGLLEGVVRGGFHRVCVFVVRDVFEHPVQNPLAKKSAALLPFASSTRGVTERGDASLEALYSGASYQENLKSQLDDFRQEANRFGVRVHVVTGENSMESVLGVVGGFVGSTL